MDSSRDSDTRLTYLPMGSRSTRKSLDRDSRKRIGDQISSHRNRRGYTQARLAELCSLSTEYISALECGKRSPSLRGLLRIARSLETSVSELLIDLGHGPDRVRIKTQIHELVDLL